MKCFLEEGNRECFEAQVHIAQKIGYTRVGKISNDCMSHTPVVGGRVRSSGNKSLRNSFKRQGGKHILDACDLLTITNV